MTDDGFEQVARFVETELGFATSHYNDSYLDRRFSARMRRTNSGDYTTYLRHLREDPQEQEALLDALSINVTGFFRNPEVWEGIAALFADLADNCRRVRVWSAACADGREAYSLAMLAHDEPAIDPQQVSIHGTDINEKALDTAEQGVYENSRTIDLDDQLGYLSAYESYVNRSNEVFEVRQQVKDLVTFEHHDLINDPPKSGYDLVLCRNLFIYIDNEYKVPVLRTVADSLRAGGYLVIGKAETIPPALQSTFRTVDSQLRIYQRQADN